MKRKISLILVVAMVVSLFTACGARFNFDVTSDGKLYGYSKMYLTDEEKKAFIEDMDGWPEEYDAGTEVIDGVKYNVLATERTLQSDEGAIITPEKFYVEAGAEVLQDPTNDFDINEELDISFTTISVTMPKAIVKTNGSLSADKKTATWNTLTFKDKAMYAYTSANPTTNPVSLKTGNAKYVKANKAIAVSTKDKVRFATLKDGTIIDGDMGRNTYINGFNICSKDKTVKFKKSGTYKFAIWTTTNKKEFVVKVDGDKPVVKGVANNKTYKKAVKIKYSDKLSGVKTATLNGKKIKSGKKITKPGKYTLVVTDRVGNKTSVKFKIKKK